MAIIRKVNGIAPQWGEGCWFADNAVLTGDVVLGDRCTLWFGTVVRGDVHSIRIGNNVNIQDNVTVHCTYKVAPVKIWDNVSIAHNAVIHGCTIENNVLIGMGAILMDGVYVEENAIVAAGAVVSKNTRIPSGTVFAGVPAKKIKDVDEALVKGEINRISNHYNLYASWYDEK